jgi:putative DNA primase/helicase
LAWCIQGCLAWQSMGLEEPKRVTEATTAYRTEQDRISAFLTENTVPGASCRAKGGKLFARYKDWAERNNETVLSNVQFSNELEERGFQKKTSNGVWYLGLALTDESTLINTEGETPYCD